MKDSNARSHHERGELFGMSSDGQTWIEPSLFDPAAVDPELF